MNEQKVFTVRCYCNDCNHLLSESQPLYRKELMNNWDTIVLGALGHKCERCGHVDVLNGHIYLKIYNILLNREFDPNKILPTPKNSPLL